MQQWLFKDISKLYMILLELNNALNIEKPKGLTLFSSYIFTVKIKAYRKHNTEIVKNKLFLNDQNSHLFYIL